MKTFSFINSNKNLKLHGKLTEFENEINFRLDNWIIISDPIEQSEWKVVRKEDSSSGRGEGSKQYLV